MRYNYSEINGNIMLKDNLFGDEFHARVVKENVIANTSLSLNLIVKFRKGLLMNYKISCADIANEKKAENGDY
jgi:hypothetical protein